MGKFSFFGNHLALDFVNTVEGRLREPVDLLGSAGDLIEWLFEGGLADPAATEALRQWCAADPATCACAVKEGTLLREALWRSFSSVASGGAVPRSAIEEVNRILALGPRIVQLKLSANGAVVRRAVRHADDLLSYVVLLAESAADFLSSLDRSRLRKCTRPACSGLFYDVSPAASRRWCEMKTCGNREKAARHHRRQKARTA